METKGNAQTNAERQAAKLAPAARLKRLFFTFADKTDKKILEK